MILPALIPKWWFKLMDQRVVEHYAGDFSKMNIYPKAKQKIQQKFAGLFSQSSSIHEDLT